MFVFNIDIDAGLSEKTVIGFAEREAVTSEILREYRISRLLSEENILSELCSAGIVPGESLRAAALRDLRSILAALSEEHRFDGYLPSVKRSHPFREYGESLERAVAARTPEALLDAIIAHYTAFGGGEAAQYIAYRWEHGLKGIARPDPIPLSGLYRIERQKQELSENTLRFLERRPANNVLLYGSSGCGKSSLVKAMLNEYYPRGLRMVQIGRDSLDELPLLIGELRGRRFRYLVFMDDLSFEGDDSGYKALKTILEGGVEEQPDNILFYATSNRMHLVSESWAERRSEEVHAADTRSEKLSLSERFGIRISFLSPGQAEYLDIVASLLRAQDIPFTEERRAEALKWSLLYNGRSGRTASQFVRSVLAARQTD